MEAKRYPKRLIPRIYWLPNIDILKLVNQDFDVYVARRIDGNREDCINEEFGLDNAFIKSDALKNSEVPDMSLSLLGALYKQSDLRYRQIKEAMNDWNGERVHAKSLIEECALECSNPWFAVAWCVKSLHNQIVPYKKNINREKEYNSFIKDINRVSEVIKMEFSTYKAAINPLSATTKLKHSPSFLNYWHFLFEIYPMGSEEPMKSTKSAWEKDLADKVAKQCLRYGFQYADILSITPLNSKMWRKGLGRCFRDLFD